MTRTCVKKRARLGPPTNGPPETKVHQIDTRQGKGNYDLSGRRGSQFTPRMRQTSVVNDDQVQRKTRCSRLGDRFQISKLTETERARNIAEGNMTMQRQEEIGDVPTDQNHITVMDSRQSNNDKLHMAENELEIQLSVGYRASQPKKLALEMQSPPQAARDTPAAGPTLDFGPEPIFSHATKQTCRRPPHTVITSSPIRRHIFVALRLRTLVRLDPDLDLRISIPSHLPPHLLPAASSPTFPISISIPALMIHPHEHRSQKRDKGMGSGSVYPVVVGLDACEQSEGKYVLDLIGRCEDTCVEIGESQKAGRASRGVVPWQGSTSGGVRETGYRREKRSRRRVRHSNGMSSTLHEERSPLEAPSSRKNSQRRSISSSIRTDISSYDTLPSPWACAIAKLVDSRHPPFPLPRAKEVMRSGRNGTVANADVGDLKITEDERRGKTRRTRGGRAVGGIVNRWWGAEVGSFCLHRRRKQACTQGESACMSPRLSSTTIGTTYAVKECDTKNDFVGQKEHITLIEGFERARSAPTPTRKRYLETAAARMDDHKSEDASSMTRKKQYLHEPRMLGPGSEHHQQTKTLLEPITTAGDSDSESEDSSMDLGIIGLAPDTGKKTTTHEL
ncbi:hypothetical protein R3P38DRAFT_3376978 [Favolaschia claudopus]|uniref:Uncharacterized protein n=1 Tax=Favolaschia claudopus TaxID=2862362 RepID=A0AAV9ZD49_9AGAR